MATAGYSGTPLGKKIGIKPGHRLALVHGPADFDLPDLPDGVDRVPDGPRGADVTVAFFRSRAELAAAADDLAAELADTAMLWVAWPRKAAGHVSDLAENDLRELFLPLGLVDVKVAALGEDWSGLKLVRRVVHRRP